jgi:hypothetical protein
MNFLKNLFGKNTNPMTPSANDAAVAEPNMPFVPEQLFAETADAASLAETEKAEPNPLEALIQKDHFGKGYQEGYDFHDARLQALYKEELIAEVRELLKNEVRRLDKELIKLNGFKAQEAHLSDSVKEMIQAQISDVEYKKSQVLDELDAAEEGRGRIRGALLRYDRGFEQGFKDFLDRNSNPDFLLR